MASLALADPHALDSHRGLRLFTVFILYIGQGIPIGLFDFALPGWMAVNGANAGEIGFVVAMSGIPWSLKFLNGFIMDRYTWLAMGRRRAWIVGAQLLMMTSLLMFAVIAPGPRDVLLLGIAALVVNTAVTLQDVAVDGLAIDILPDSERSYASGIMSGGQSLGMAASAGLAGFMIYNYGVSAAYLTCATLVGLVTVHILWVRERTGEKRLPWSSGGAHPRNHQIQAVSWLPLLKGTLSGLLAGKSLLFTPVLFVRGMGYGFFIVAVPLLAAQYAGWSEDQIGALNGSAQLVSGAVVVLLGGWIVERAGAQRLALTCYALVAALVGVLLVAQGSWSDGQALTGFVYGWNIVFTLLLAALMVLAMRLTLLQVSATQFSIYMAIHNLGISFAGLVVGTIVASSGLAGLFATLIVLQLLAIAVLIVVRFPPGQEIEVQTPSPRD
jgi:PAT family beta-lactamase induction signal transducer AmpG